jgi:hypothetical protein
VSHIESNHWENVWAGQQCRSILRLREGGQGKLRKALWIDCDVEESIFDAFRDHQLDAESKKHVRWDITKNRRAVRIKWGSLRTWSVGSNTERRMRRCAMRGMSMKDARRALSLAVEDRLRNPTRGMPAAASLSTGTELKWRPENTVCSRS